MLKFDKSSYTYTSLFCEENIWKLIDSLSGDKKIEALDVLFLLNESATVAIFNQLRSTIGQPVIWDYHVILCASINNKPYIFDFDSRCSFPSKIDDYFKDTFSDGFNISEKYQHLLKVINADDYYQHFTSDRSHMRGIIPESEFPKYEIIQDSNNQTELLLSNCRDIFFVTDKIRLLSPETYLRKITTAK